MNPGNAVLFKSRTDPTRLLAHVQMLSEQIGPRPFASPAEEQASRYIEQALEGYGIRTTRQTFYARSYDYHLAAEIIGPEAHEITCVPYLELFFQPGETHYCASLVKPDAKDVAGKVVLLPSTNFLPLDVIAECGRRGARAILTYYRFSGPLIKRPALRDHLQRFSAFVHRWRLPIFLISESDGQYIESILAQSPYFAFSLTLRRPCRPAYNIIGQIGTGDAGMIISAHHDSDWTVPSPGACDNAAGVAVLLETARILTYEHRKRTFRPDRYVRFVSFAAEEYFGLGSLVYCFPSLRRWTRFLSPLLLNMAGQVLSKLRITRSPQVPVINLDSLGRGGLLAVAVTNGMVAVRSATMASIVSNTCDSVGDFDGLQVGVREDAGNGKYFARVGHPVISITSAEAGLAMFEHSTGDTSECLDAQYLARTVEFVCNLARAILPGW